MVVRVPERDNSDVCVSRRNVIFRPVSALHARIFLLQTRKVAGGPRRRKFPTLPAPPTGTASRRTRADSPAPTTSSCTTETSVRSSKKFPQPPQHRITCELLQAGISEILPGSTHAGRHESIHLQGRRVLHHSVPKHTRNLRLERRPTQ